MGKTYLTGPAVSVSPITVFADESPGNEREGSRCSDDEWRDKQHDLIIGDEWILDGNYHATLDLRLERADTAVFLDTSWWVCAWRALIRGVSRRPVGFQLPDGCDESTLRRLREEWSLAWRIWRVHRYERELELGILSRHANHVALYVLPPRTRPVTFLVHKCRIDSI